MCKEKNVVCHSSSTRIKPLATAIFHWKDVQICRVEKKQETFCALALDSLDPYLRKIFKGLQILASSHQHKSTKTFNLRRLFFVVSSNILMFDYMFFLEKEKVHIYPSSSLTSLEKFFSAIWDVLLCYIRFPNKT